MSPTELDTRRRRLGLSNDEYTTLIGGDHGYSVALGGLERITAAVRDHLAATRAVDGAVLLAWSQAPGALVKAGFAMPLGAHVVAVAKSDRCRP